MYIALGFCAAGLIGLAILPAFYRRAARLTEEALRAVNPSSYAEVRAAQDQARARHAIELRRVERQLDDERTKAAKHHLEVSRLRTEIEALNRGHKAQVSGLETKLGALHGDQKAVDLLSSEVTALKEKLAETETALAESWKTPAQEDASQKPEDNPQDNSDWLPAADTMTLAKITGLEAEVATLKSRLSKHEPVEDMPPATAQRDPAISKLAEMEAQLVDTESKYVTAQAEVARLSLLLDAGTGIEARDEQQHDDRASEALDELKRENVQQNAELIAKNRTLDRMNGQLEKLRSDLLQAPGLIELRQEFKALAAKLAGTGKPAAAGAVQQDIPAENAAATDAAEKPKTRQVVVPGGKSAKPQSIKVRATKITHKKEEAETSAKSSEIATAAEALVSRIVASNRKNGPEEETAVAGAQADADNKADAAPETDPEDKPTKQNKKDVA